MDYDIFVNAPKPDFTDPTHVVAVDAVDLRLSKGAVAIDAGTVLPNVTDGFSGARRTWALMNLAPRCHTTGPVR